MTSSGLMHFRVYVHTNEQCRNYLTLISFARIADEGEETFVKRVTRGDTGSTCSASPDLRTNMSEIMRTGPKLT